MRKILLLLCLLLSLALPSVLGGDTLRLGADSVAAMRLGGPPLCRISEDGRYSWQSGELLPLEGFFSFHTAAEQPLEARYEVSDQGSRGGVLHGSFLFSEAVDRLEGTVQQLEGELGLQVRGFPLDDSGRSWYFLVGIPSTAEAGEYCLEISASRGRRFVLYRRQLPIHHRSFRSEEIAFNQALTELMTVPDPQKVEEYRQLGRLLMQFHARSLFQTGTLIVPVESRRRTSHFADRRLYSYTDGGSSRSLHNGIDLAAPVGTPVFASGAGRVLLAGQRIISGNSVVIEHLPGVLTLYYHLEEIAVQEGQRVFQGQQIGTVGMSGLATGPHLHWELRVGGVAVDPDFFVENPMIDKSARSHNIMDRN
ncbi:MAG: M23 family metallopeptidase [Spirochaetales bacterium]|nr:M23 family metallopeptidase [Spirochaetales bacterium]